MNTDQPAPATPAPELPAPAPETYVPRFAELQYGWVLCMVAFDRWPEVWEYMQWHTDQWREFAKERGLDGSRRRGESVDYAYDRVLAACGYDNEKAHAALHAWLAPRVAQGLTLDQTRERVHRIYDARKRSRE